MMKTNLLNRLSLLLILIALTSCFRANDFEALITPLQTGSEASIRALHVVDSNIVWAGGSGGQFLLTANGGVSWKTGSVTLAEDDDLRSIHAWDASRAQFFGTSPEGKAYMTETAGEDWTVVYENNTPGIFFNSLNYADEFRGIALSDPVDSVCFLIRTSDGGRSWERVVNLPKLIEGEYNFAASNSCLQYNASGKIWIISGGQASRVFSSVDDGNTWKVSESGLVSGSPSSGIFSVSFLDDEKGIIVGGTYDKPGLNNNIAAFTLDGGTKWIKAEKMPAEFRSSVIWLRYRKKNIALAVGKTGIDISTDHGNSWTNISVDGYYTARAVPGTAVAYLAGSDGRISKIEIVRKRKNKDN